MLLWFIPVSPNCTGFFPSGSAIRVRLACFYFTWSTLLNSREKGVRNLCIDDDSLKMLALTSPRAVTRQCPANLADCVSLTSHHDSEQSPQYGDPAYLADVVRRAAGGRNVSQPLRHKAEREQYVKRLTPPENVQTPALPLGPFLRGEFVPSGHGPAPWLTLLWRQ
jgi:hypothetical protein